ncbi:MAG: hypothetical protein K9L64_02880 [Candidatus Izimaplasma sp.]|nr:hypothetical protein [Candidatus Izimaplasma bacterium]
MSYNINETVRLNNLYDIYHELLTDKQKLYFNYYFREDYSLSEIAEIMDVSRNAVHLQIKKVSKYLEDYEKKLRILENNIKISELINELEDKHSLTKEIKETLEKIKKV